ncbi:MAG: ATP-binding protein [Vicinamibacteria bacterium]
MPTRDLYLGKAVDPKTGAQTQRLDLRSSDLLTHGLIVGMTGSGKTGLAIALVEELLGRGVPVLAIDPKGDLGNLLLLFEDLQPASFGPWIDPQAAAREGLTPEAAGTAAAESWRKGLAEWELGSADIAALKRAHDARIYTPGSSAGRALNVLQSLAAPEVPFASAEEDLRDEIAGIVSGLLGLVRVDADPLAREAVLLSNLIEHSWRAGQDLSLEGLIGAIGDPPFEKLGALPLESLYPRKERQALMTALNNLLASPSFESWRQGDPLEVESLLFTPERKPRLSIVHLAHLDDAERLFVTALLLDKLKTWMRRQAGTSELRAVLYMDEVYGFFPPHPLNPPTKKPLLTLLKQARAHGVGVVLATQNPVDLDYKGLANMGTWLVGKLQTDQDRERLREGLLGTGADAKTIDALLGAARKRVFLLHDVHRDGPTLLHSRFVMSYLRGPLTRGEISRLTQASGAPAPAAAASGSEGEGPPVLPPPFRHHYLRSYGGELADAHLLVKYAVRFKGVGEAQAVKAWPLASASATELLEAEPLDVDEAALAPAPPAALRYGELPSWLASAGARGIEKVLKDRLPDKLGYAQLVDPATKLASQPGEDAAAFVERVAAAGGGARVAKLADQRDKKRRELAQREQDLSGRKQEKWMALGSAILSNIGLVTGRKRSISGAATVLSKNRMENNAEARVDALRAEIAALEEQIRELSDVDAARFEQKPIVAAKTDVKLLRYDVVWIY